MSVLTFVIINYFILSVFPLELSEAQKLLLQKSIRPEKLKKGIQFGVTLLVELLLEEEGSGACYRGHPYIPECTLDELEDYEILVGRICYKKCEDYELEQGNIYYHCENGKKITKREAIYNDDNIVELTCGFLEKPISRIPEQVKNSHCMANTTLIDGKCYKDCSILGLKPFRTFCAKNEKDYNNFFKDQLFNIIKYSIKTLTSFFLDKIFVVESDSLSDATDYFSKLFAKIKKNKQKETVSIFTKSIGAIKDKIAKLGKQNLLDKITKSFKKLTKDIIDDEEIVNKMIKFLAFHMDKMIDKTKLEKINSNKKLDKALNEAMGELKSTFDFTLDTIYNCKYDKNFNLDDCFDSIMDTVESLDPTYWVGFIRELISLVPPVCDITVKPEHSKNLMLIEDKPGSYHP